MWRLKLKETLERFTVLDCKNWTCGTPKVQQQQQQQHNSSSTINTTSANDEKSTLDSNINNLIKCKTIDHLSFGPEIFLPRWKTCTNSRKSSSGSSNDNENRKSRKKISDNENQLTEDILGAITWSGAIIFSWYASQILCTRRRHLTRTSEEHNKNKYLKYLYIPKRTVCLNINSNYVSTSPIDPQNSTVNISDRIKYVDISLLQYELSNNSKKYKNLVNQSQNKLNLHEITNTSQLEKTEVKRRKSSASFAEHSTNSNISSTDIGASKKSSRVIIDTENKLLDNFTSNIIKKNVSFTKPEKNLLKSSTDSSEASITSTDVSEQYSTRSESYGTEDSTSFIVFENSNEFTCSSNNKINPQKDTVILTDDKSSKTSEIPTLTEAVSDLAQYIADFEYNVALQHIKEKDYKSAVPHLKRASTHMHPNGIFNLGLCYENGLGVRRNLEAAAECYQRASHLGHPKATFNLGVFYAKGLGEIPKNIDIARKCVITAAKLGQPEAIGFLNAMAVKDEEIAKYLKEQKGRTPSIDSGL